MSASNDHNFNNFFWSNEHSDKRFHLHIWSNLMIKDLISAIERIQ